MISLQVEGMTCINCAQSISRVIERHGGEKVSVDFATGEARFEMGGKASLDQIIGSINALGYRVVPHQKVRQTDRPKEWSDVEKRFLFCLVFTVPLFSHMLLPFIHWLQQPLVQFFLCIPVFVAGAQYFGRSTLSSLKTGLPNMDVLIMLGSTAAFIYSITGIILYYGTSDVYNYLFFETTATILTLVLLGNVLEQRSIRQTASAIEELGRLQATTARRIIQVNNRETTEEVEMEHIGKGDILLVNTGDKVPADGEVVWGSCAVDESMLTGESVPVDKMEGTVVFGGTLLIHGSIKVKATAVGQDSALSSIIEMVKAARQNKPVIQRLGDRVSAIFVPVVVVIAAGTFLVSYFIAGIPLSKSLMSSVAVLVIACPCAMGLATPTAVMVGIGRAAKNGILIRGGSILEQLASVRKIVFDKTGTLTTGNFSIKNIECLNSAHRQDVIDILFNLEQHSSHPIARSIAQNLMSQATPLELCGVTDDKGLGVKGADLQGNTYRVGSERYAGGQENSTLSETDTLFVMKNDRILAKVNLSDEPRERARETIMALRKQNIQPVMLSGDAESKCRELGERLGIDRIYWRMLPEQKLKVIEEMAAEFPTAMVGDGINDAPALARATVGISFSSATQVAIQSAQVVLLNSNDLYSVNHALQVSKTTLLTIKQNLFWAFFYNIVAIPIAAAGLLNPMIGALAMAFSDVIIIGNSLRLKVKKIGSLQ